MQRVVNGFVPVGELAVGDLIVVNHPDGPQVERVASVDINEEYNDAHVVTEHDFLTSEYSLEVRIPTGERNHLRAD